jgi:hypothetical protein
MQLTGLLHALWPVLPPSAQIAELENTEQARTFGIGSKRFERKNDGVSNIVYCESPFEEQVVEFLENEGYDIECQYGAGKFRLDIIVKERGKNLLAIECDGAAYHSSLVARTRDRRDYAFPVCNCFARRALISRIACFTRWLVLARHAGQ